MGYTFKHFLFGFIFLLECTIHVFISCCSVAPKSFGTMSKDAELLVGSPLKVQCNLSSNKIIENNTEYYVTSKDLIIKFESEALNNLKIVNNYTVEYYVQNSTINDTGTYTCYLSIPELNYNPFICTTYITVGYKPQPVQNFSCISMHYENLTCVWVPPPNPIKTNYTLWNYIRSPLLKRGCAVQLNSTACQWRLDTKPIYRKSSKFLTFILDGVNSLGNNTQYISVDHFKIVKPDRPTHIEFPADNITENSMVIQWLPPQGMEYGEFPPGLLYSIQYRPLNKPFAIYKEINVSAKHKGSALIEGLIPHTDYEFKIRCRSNKAESEDMWSTTYTTSCRTLPDVPYLAPEITSSSFDIETIIGNRTITLYWKPVPFEYENGDNFHYVINYHLYYVPSRVKREYQEVIVGNVSSYSFKHMDINSAYFFNIYAKNDVGVSKNSTHIVIDKASKILEGPKDISVLSYGLGKYVISWKAYNNKPTNFTLFWCKTIKPRPFKCDTPLEWLITSQMHEILHLPDKTTNYQFSVAAMTNDQTSNMVWASCIVSYDGVRYKVKKVELTPRNSTSLKVQWSLDCEAQKSVIKEYAIHYCEVPRTDGMCTDGKNITCKSDWRVENVNNLVEEYDLSFLKPYTCYEVFVRSRTISGWSENSNIVFESTHDSAPSDPPQNVKVVKIEGKTVHLSFSPPHIPNGIITKYIITYNNTATNNNPRHVEIHAIKGKQIYNVIIDNSLSYYTKYSIGLKACVKLSCSIQSKPVYALTEIARPHIMHSPRIEITDSPYINITWEPPRIPNGPIDKYQVLKTWKEANKTEETSKLYEVDGNQTYLSLKHECLPDVDDNPLYEFKVRAVNIKRTLELKGEYSMPTKTILCPGKEGSIAIIVGITVGCAVGLVVLIFVIYSLAAWMKNEVDMIKGINVQLPKGLDSPLDNPLNSYDKFKNGLQQSTDSGIAYERTYARLCSFASEGNLKNIENDYILSEDELSCKKKRDGSGRNSSGESNASETRCQDSIASSHTVKTHLSIDSGAEVESPDGFFSDTSSSNTTPRSYKPDLAIVDEGSKDSGLEKKEAQPAYSKFGITPAYVPFASQSLRLIECRMLSNSEPSVDSEPIAPYSKFGLARSTGHGLDSKSTYEKLPKNISAYSKFGVQSRPVCNGYVSYREALLNSPCLTNNVPRNQGYVTFNEAKAMTPGTNHVAV